MTCYNSYAQCFQTKENMILCFKKDFWTFNFTNFVRMYVLYFVDRFGITYFFLNLHIITVLLLSNIYKLTAIKSDFDAVLKDPSFAKDQTWENVKLDLLGCGWVISHYRSLYLDCLDSTMYDFHNSTDTLKFLTKKTGY